MKNRLHGAGFGVFLVRIVLIVGFYFEILFQKRYLIFSQR